MRAGLELAPNWAPGIVVLAQLQARQGQFAEAKENANTALELDSETREVLDGAIDVTHLTGISTTQYAFTKRTGKQPADAKWRLLLANDLSQLERFDEALALWKASC